MFKEIHIKLENSVRKQEVIKSDIADLKKNQIEILELKNIRTKTKNAMDGFNIRLDTAKERINSTNCKTGKKSISRKKHGESKRHELQKRSK